MLPAFDFLISTFMNRYYFRNRNSSVVVPKYNGIHAVYRCCIKRILFHPYHGFMAYATVYMHENKLRRTYNIYIPIIYDILCNDSQKNNFEK